MWQHACMCMWEVYVEAWCVCLCVNACECLVCVHGVYTVHVFACMHRHHVWCIYGTHVYGCVAVHVYGVCNMCMMFVHICVCTCGVYVVYACLICVLYGVHVMLVYV